MRLPRRLGEFKKVNHLTLCLVFSRYLIKLAIIFKVNVKQERCCGIENSDHCMTDTKKIKP